MGGNPLANLGDLTKPATVLIEKISGAIGGIFKPYQMVRVAKAEAAADQIRAESQIHITDLHRRALHRFLEEEAKRQSNIEQITQKALPLLNEKSSPQNVEDDWITNFFDKCRIVSDQEMQKLWSGVLAGEANNPGAFARRTVNLLADLDKSDAELFTKLCGFGCTIGDFFTPLVFAPQAPSYTEQGINFESLYHLESLGFIQFDSHTGFNVLNLPKACSVTYFGKALDLYLRNESDNQLQTGHVVLTRAGQQLARVCRCTPIAGFFEMVRDYWKKSYALVEREATSPPTEWQVGEVDR
jgi:hypothetical protein